jgi:hypothetical protein
VLRFFEYRDWIFTFMMPIASLSNKSSYSPSSVKCSLSIDTASNEIANEILWKANIDNQLKMYLEQNNLIKEKQLQPNWKHGLKQFSIAQTILTKSPMYLSNLSRNLHCLIHPLALSTTHLTFVFNLDLFASLVVCFFAIIFLIF